ncbi:MAG: mannosyl-3-phosphoglycerate phosphatase [Nitrospiria bacterium]
MVIFTDLDGTLLDHKSYSWEAASPALNLIKQRAIPLVLCSSKTWTEIEALRHQLDNHDPFIPENGGGIFIPNGYFDFSFAFQKKVSHYQVIELGTPYSRLREALLLITQQTGIHLKGYGDLSAGEISAQTGLSIQDAHLSKQREYDEPFIFMGTDEQRKRILRLIEEMGLNWTKGSRFDHLTGANDKGKAVRILRELFKHKFGKNTTVALGDSPNDLPMLAAVDYPILIQRPGGGYEESIQLPGLIRAGGIGPEGWRNAILKLLASLAD